MKNLSGKTYFTLMFANKHQLRYCIQFSYCRGSGYKETTSILFATSHFTVGSNSEAHCEGAKFFRSINRTCTQGKRISSSIQYLQTLHNMTTHGVVVGRWKLISDV